MIDSICLSIPWREIQNVGNDWDLLSRTERYSRYIKNPTKSDLETGYYFPRLTSYSKWFNQNANVRIEFSVSKLVFLNNLDELEDADFPKVVATLQERLKTMGLIISEESIRNAVVSSVHFSKNILVEDGYTTNYLISEINKVNLRKVFDFTRSRYTNDGQSLYAHTASHEFIIYDKVADILASEKRAIDRDQTHYQRGLFCGAERLPEIIRFEVRLVRKQKMNKVLEKLGYSQNPSFQDVFNSKLSKDVVTHYWQAVIKEGNNALLSISLSNKDILQSIFLEQKDIKPKQAIYLAGLLLLAKDGVRELRSIVSKKSGERTWYRISKDLKLVSEFVTKNGIRNWVAQIDSKLDEFRAYKCVEYPQEQSCNVKQSKVS